MAETLIAVKVRHRNPLPAGLTDKIAARVFDAAATRGEQVEVTAQEWYALSLPVKEMQ